jgi:hypothetical protein
MATFSKLQPVHILGVRWETHRVGAAAKVGIRTYTANVDHLTDTERQVYEHVLTEARALKRSTTRSRGHAEELGRTAE